MCKIKSPGVFCLFCVVCVSACVCVCFFFFFEILIFWAVFVKGQKNSPKWKITTTSVTHHISQEQYSIWSWYLQGSFFEIFFFRAVREGGVKGQKIAENEKFHPSCTIYLRNSIAYGHDFSYTCVKQYLQVVVVVVVLFCFLFLFVFSFFWNFVFSSF